MCPHFKISILFFKYNNLLNFKKLTVTFIIFYKFGYFYFFFFYLLMIIFFTYSDIFHFIFNKYI